MNFLSRNKIQPSLFMKSSQLTPKNLLRDELKARQEERYNDFISCFGIFAIDGKVMMSKYACFSIDHL